MKKSLLCFVPLLMLCGTVFGDINTLELLPNNQEADKIKEGVVLPIPEAELNQKWTLAFKEISPKGSWIFEWIPKDEEIKNWSEIIQIQFLPASVFGEFPPSAEDFAKLFIDSFKKQFPDIKTNMTVTVPDIVLIEWTLTKPVQGEKPQHELARVIATPNGIYRIAYTKKIANMGNTLRETWSNRLLKAHEIERQKKGVK